MKITDFEQYSINDGYIDIYQDDCVIGLIISDYIENVEKIVRKFHDYIIKGENHEAIIKLGSGLELEFELSHDVNKKTFSLQGSVLGGSFYHEFDIECCDIETWNELCKFIGIKFLKEKIDKIIQL